jgi:hypothetical protein
VLWNPEATLLYPVAGRQTHSIYECTYIGNKVLGDVVIRCGNTYTFEKQKCRMFVLGIYVHTGRKYVHMHFAHNSHVFSNV